MKGFILFFFIFLFWGFKVFSQSNIDCSNVKTQAEITLCVQQQYKEADKQLNIIYGKVSAKADAKQRAELLNAQRSWIVYRDKHAAMYGLLYAGGSIAQSLILNSKLETTLVRVKELQELLNTMEL